MEPPPICSQTATNNPIWRQTSALTALLNPGAPLRPVLFAAAIIVAAALFLLGAVGVPM